MIEYLHCNVGEKYQPELFAVPVQSVIISVIIPMKKNNLILRVREDGGYMLFKSTPQIQAINEFYFEHGSGVSDRFPECKQVKYVYQ